MAPIQPLGTGEVAYLLHCTVTTVIRWHREGRLLPDMQDANGRRIYFPETVAKFQQERAQINNGGVR